MKVTDALKSKLIELKLIDKDADDEAIKTAATEALMEEKLTIPELKELQKDPDAGNGGQITQLLKQLIEQGETKGDGGGSGNEGDEKKPEDKKIEHKLPSWAGKDVSRAMAGMGVDLGDAKEGTGFYASVNVKTMEGLYSTEKHAPVFGDETKSGNRHPLAGQKAFEFTDSGKRYVEGTSDLEKAVNGAFFKFQLNGNGSKVPRGLRMTDHDNHLMKYALNEMKWGGTIAAESYSKGGTGIKNRKLTQSEIKTVIDDVATGGLEIAPISFDDQVITIPILFGEVAPFINMVPITRGRRIESATMGNVIVTSGGSVTDNVSIPLFNTAGFITAFDTTIHVVHGAIEIGRDLMSDSPIDIAGHVTTKYGEQLLAWLDEQVCIGDGVIEPEGIMVASGTTAVSFGGVTPTVGGYEALLFGVPKRYKQATDKSRIRFVSNETTYSRARGIAVGTADARRVFGMDEENYNLFNHGYSIVDTMANTQAFFANLARYRMYRRMGITIDMTTEGRELTLRNKLLISMRARYGGRTEDGLANAVSTDMLA